MLSATHRSSIESRESVAAETISITMPSTLAQQLRLVAERDYLSVAAVARALIARGLRADDIELVGRS